MSQGSQSATVQHAIITVSRLDTRHVILVFVHDIKIAMQRNLCKV